MMLAKVKERLLLASCDAWEITETATSRWEFYFIGHKLDQNRVVTTSDTEVKVYKSSEEGKYLGNAVDQISPTATEEEIDRTIEKLIFQASLVKNPYYTLTDTPVPAGSEAEIDVAAIAKDAITALTEVPETADEDINSYEIFVSGVTKRFENSCGVSYVCSYPSTEIEVVVNARKDGHEIELHRIYNSGTCDKEKLKENVTRVLQFGADRLKAQPTPKLGTADVIFSTQDATSIYYYFVDLLHADYKVRKISDYEIGQPIAKEMKGDRPTIRVVLSLPNSNANHTVDREGCEIYERNLMKDGVPENFCGSRQFSQYLGLKKSSLAGNIVVEGGKKTEEEIRQGNYLEVVEFSDFQVDAMGGDIAGEIRLGYWHHDGKVTVVTGGSISGSMGEAIPLMEYSAETEQYNNIVIPRVTRLNGLRVTGV